ncbi:hypothetical protein GINT2_002056 [Glugoides intestinalis]
MNEQQLKRRVVAQEASIDIPFHFKLIILLRSRKEAMYFCTKSSVALRAIILCQLSVENVIVLKNEIVKVEKSPQEKIQKDFAHMISQVSFSTKELLEFLNGEGAKMPGIKDLRKTIYNEMASKGLIKVKKSHLFNKISLQDFDTWQRIFEKIVYEIQDNKPSIETVVLLSALKYINGMDSLLIQCNETVAKSIVKIMEDITSNIKKKQFPQKDGLIYQILSILLHV